MKLLAAVLFQLCLLNLVLGQERCTSDGGGGGGSLVGFTALTPDQFRKEMKDAIQETLSVALEDFTEKETAEELSCMSVLAMLQVSVEEMNHTLILSQERLVQRLEETVRSALREGVRNLSLVFENTLSTLSNSPPPTPPPSITTTTTTTTPLPITRPTPPQPPPGFTPSLPAKSCQEVLEAVHNAPSGRYWISAPSVNATLSVYCDMTRVCGNLTGGWMRVAYVDMTLSDHQCPGGFVELTQDEPPRRLCTPDSDGSGCFSHTFPIGGMEYSRVCGQVIGYQEKTPNAFFPFHVRPSTTIDENYVDGISLTHGNPRSHIWTFAAALDETPGHLSSCTCTNVVVLSPVSVPPFVGNDYFCATGSREDVAFKLYSDDPLWDGKGCGPLNACCSFNDPPWFFKELPSPSSDGIEMRLCRDAAVSNENIPFEVIELYIR